MKIYHYYTDSGHGWLRVPKKELIKYNISNKITGYSYKTEKYIYLEEDCDMPNFLNILRENKQDFIIKEHFVNGYSNIRKYERYETV